MNKIFLIIQREYLSRVRKKSFVVMTLLGPLLIAAFIVAFIWLSLSEDDNQKILIVDETPQLFETLYNTKNIQFDYIPNLKLSEAKKMFEQSDHTAILYIPQNIMSGNKVNLFFNKQPSFGSQQAITNKIEQIVENYKLKKNNISRETYFRIKANIVLSTIRVKETGKEEKVDKEATFVGYFFAVLIYMFIFMYGVQVLKGVSEEKTNRIVEIIISSVKPFQLMMGKIIGVALVGITQFVLWIILTVTITLTAQSVLFADKYNATQLQETVQMSTQMKQQVQEESAMASMSLNDATDILQRINFPLMLGMFLFYFLGGYLLYSSLFAAVGAAVDSDTDSQQFMMPITIPLILALLVANIIVQNPEGQLAFWFSIIPFTSPIVMLVRLAVGIGDGGIPIWEVALSMGLLVISFLLTTWLAAKIYRVGILMYGKKVSYKELWKWLRY